jgi:hypothetical protein
MYQYYLVIIHLMLIKIYPFGKVLELEPINYMVFFDKKNKLKKKHLI